VDQSIGNANLVARTWAISANNLNNSEIAWKSAVDDS
jgi:hypothetical protein